MGTSLTSAPAVVGAVSLGSAPTITHTATGCRVSGTDFVTTCSPLSSVFTTWATVAGFAVAPYSMGSNTLADMSRMYKEFCVRRLAVAYVPSVGTATNGQVAIYRKPDRASPHIDPGSANFFPYVLNQRTGVVGPVWQPLTIEFPTSNRWISSVPLDGTDIDEECDGEIFVATNNSVSSGVAPSVGMVKVFYIIEFKGMERNPRSALIPLANQIYVNTSLGINNVNASAGDPFSPNIISTDQAGAVAALPGGAIPGDIFKFFVDMSRSTTTPTSPTNTFATTLLGQRIVVPLSGSMTFYALFTTNGWNLYLTYQQALTQSGGIVFNIAVTANGTILRGMLSLVANISTRTQISL